jgi:hypothetical protein
MMLKACFSREDFILHPYESCHPRLLISLSLFLIVSLTHWIKYLAGNYHNTGCCCRRPSNSLILKRSYCYIGLRFDPERKLRCYRAGFKAAEEDILFHGIFSFR